MESPKPEIRIYKSPGKSIQVILLTTPFVLVGLWMLHLNPINWVGWMSVLFFGLGYPLGLYHLLDRRPQIIINEVGVFDRSLQSQWINWELVERAYLGSIHGQKFISLVLQPGFEPSLRQSAWRRWIASWNKELGFQELNINLNPVQVDEAKLCVLINLLAQSEYTERKPLLHSWETSPQP